jgi:hypothetical protein
VWASDSKEGGWLDLRFQIPSENILPKLDAGIIASVNSHHFVVSQVWNWKIDIDVVADHPNVLLLLTSQTHFIGNPVVGVFPYFP